jgi:hypothetical protein
MGLGQTYRIRFIPDGLSYPQGAEAMDDEFMAPDHRAMEGLDRVLGLFLGTHCSISQH